MIPPALAAEPGVRVAHVGVAVTSIAAAVAFYRDVLGLPTTPPETVDGATVVSVALGPSQVEFLEATDPGGPVGRFVARRGPGIHHVCLRVPDLDAALVRCRAMGYRLVDDVPRPGAHGRRVAFIHPRSTAGILLELTD